MSNKADVDFLSFFIFNSLYGPNEGEEEKKILFYYPSSEKLNTKIKNIGLVEGLRQFTSVFKPNEPLSALHTQKTRQLYYEPEKNFWMVLTLEVPHAMQVKEGNDHCEYLEEELQDNVYEAVLKQAYAMYRLFNTTYEMCLESHGMEGFKQKLEQFYSAYLKTIKWPNCDVLDVFNGMQYLPLDKQTFLSVQCFVNTLESFFPCIKYTAFLYNDNLIWSGLDPEDMQLIYQYLIGTFLPANLEIELQGGPLPRNTSAPFRTLPHGRFITGKEDSFSVKKIPIVYTYSQHQSSYYMLVYRVLSATVCLFVEGKNLYALNEKNLPLSTFRFSAVITKIITEDFLKEVDDMMNPRLTALANSIAEYCHKVHSTAPSNHSENSPRFIYFNRYNLACKSSVHLDNRHTGNVACPKDSLKLMADICDSKNFLGDSGEIILKTTNDYWVVGRTSNSREFYIALQLKNANVVDINDEIQKLCETELKGIYFQTV